MVSGQEYEVSAIETVNSALITVWVKQIKYKTWYSKSSCMAVSTGIQIQNGFPLFVVGRTAEFDSKTAAKLFAVSWPLMQLDEKNFNAITVFPLKKIESGRKKQIVTF